MKKFIKKLIGFSLGPIIGAIISFLTIPVTTYFISPAEFGKASMFTMVQALVVTLIYLGMDQSYTKEYHYISNKKLLFQNALSIPILVSLLMMTIVSIFSSNFSYFLFDSPDYGYLANLFSVMIVFSTIERFVLLSIRMEEKAIEYSFFNVFLKIIIFFITIVLIFMGHRTFKTIIYSAVFGQIIGDLILIFRYKDLFKFKLSNFDLELIKRMLIFGLPLIIAASVNNLLNTSGRYFLRGFSSYHELGIYTSAIKIAGLIQIVQMAFTSFWVPTAYRWNKEKKDIKNFSFVGDLLLLLMTFGFYFILFFKKYIVLILSSNYSDAQYITGLVALTPILYTLSETTTLGIVFSGKSFYNVWISLMALLPNLLINFLLVPKYGTVGAAVATAISYIIFCFGRTYFSRKCGFKIRFAKQGVCIILFFISACLNTLQESYVFEMTFVLFMLTLLVQLRTFKDIKNIYKFPELWDFE